MTCVIALAPSTLHQAVTLTHTLLQRFALCPNFISSLKAVFGHDFNTSLVLDLGQAWRRGDFHDLLNLEVCPAAEIDEAMGVFFQANNTIYLSQEFLNLFSDDPKIIAGVLLEEIGNYLDAKIHWQDNRREKGGIFSDLVRGYLSLALR
jgi:hypothetical protein